MVLTSEQVKAIANRVDDGGIFMDSLKDDLIDHICCAIESRMSNGIPFETAFSEAMKDLAPFGLNEIQMQTIFLLHPKMLIMKKVMYILGLATTISMTMGLTFKILHMPGADQLFNYGFLTFALVFLPMVAIKKFMQKEKRSMYEKLKTTFGFVSTVGVGTAVLLKMVTKLEMSSVFLLISISIFCFGFLPFLFYDLYRESLKSPEKENNLEDQLL
jgi:hypothetical protein